MLQPLTRVLANGVEVLRYNTSTHKGDIFWVLGNKCSTCGPSKPYETLLWMQTYFDAGRERKSKVL